MNMTAIIFMIVILTILWGGFTYTLFTAIKREAKKN